MENWLDHQPQTVVISLADGQLLVIYCLTLTTCTLGQDAPSAGLQTTPTGEVVNMLEGRAPYSRDLNILGKCFDRNLFRFNKGKCQFLQLGWTDLM